MKFALVKLIVILIFLSAASFRLNNINWDKSFHLHPDERFLTMVGNDIKFPNNFFDYLDPKISSFNPRNNNYLFFVYGIFPITVNKIIAFVFNTDNYNDFTNQGRILSSIVDLLTIFYLYKVVELLEKKHKLSPNVKLWSCFFYGAMVFPIQLSHFFTVDTFLNFFMFTSFYYSLKFSLNKKKIDFFLSALFFALGLASKITAFYILPLNIALWFNKKIKWRELIKHLIAYALISYSILRFADPYMFESPNFFNPYINKIFFKSLLTLKSFEGADSWYPPSIQWIDKTPIFHSLLNMFLFGVGVVISAFFVTGVINTFKKYKKYYLALPLIWLIIFLIYQSIQFFQFMRYFIIAYPYIAIYSGLGVVYLFHFVQKKRNINVIYFLIIVLVLIWPVSFSKIYGKSHTRIEASDWMYKNIKNKSVILSENWDDSLPLSVKDSNKVFINKQLPVFDPDDTSKWTKMNNLLGMGDYLVLSSSRGWGSISRLPKKYPKMSGFYRDLLSGFCHPR